MELRSEQESRSQSVWEVARGAAQAERLRKRQGLGAGHGAAVPGR